MKWGLHFIAVLLIAGTSCSKSNGTHSLQTDSSSDTSANILTYQIEGTNPLISFPAPSIFTAPSIDVQFADSILTPGNFVASFTLSPDAKASIQGIDQTSGVSAINFNKTILYTITSASGKIKDWQVLGTNNNYTINWGLGQWLQKAHSNNRDYNWYINQLTTDSCGDVNCGPTSVTMAIKWADSTNTKTVTDARTAFRNGCGTWSTFYVADYLNQNSIPYAWIPLPDSSTQMRDSFKAQIDSGRILIIELYMVIRPGLPDPNSRADSYYNDAFDHFIILKGYKQVDDELFFEVYDPWGLSEIYPDGTPKGENRYYRYEDIFAGCSDVGAGGTGIAEIVVSQK
jgi:Peptidase_C39 like family